ncbi:MAG TPA: vWA domain-containing protein [Polyangiaceae bacterium]|nr:vWA domain-containing protein [Polyangiaceae bacterium]
MRGLSLGLSLGVGVACGVVACSAGKATPGSGVDGRPVATAGAANGGTAGKAGPAPIYVAGNGGSGQVLEVVSGAGMDAGSDVPVEAGTCDDLTIQTYEAVPTVLLLVDTSGSMFQPRDQLWDPLYKALTDPTKGVVATLQDKVRFGFTSYTSTDPLVTATCPTLVSTDLKLKNFDTIKTAYTDIGTKTALNPNGGTPTGPSIVAVTKKLLEFKPEPPGPKFILLVTDGDPDTCTTANPNCGQDESIKAIQDAYAAGIGTFVIGIGDVANKFDASMRTGPQHLQDIANAGVGQPVAPNTESYTYSECYKKTNGYTATYAPTVAEGGAAKYYTVTAKDGTTAQTQIADAILASLAQARSCTFNMDAQVTGDASLGVLTFNGSPLTFGDPNGWTLGADLTSVTLNGTTCDSWKKDGGKVNVNFPCKLVPVVHVPVPQPE